MSEKKGSWWKYEQQTHVRKHNRDQLQIVETDFWGHRYFTAEIKAYYAQRNHYVKSAAILSLSNDKIREKELQEWYHNSTETGESSTIHTSSLFHKGCTYQNDWKNLTKEKKSTETNDIIHGRLVPSPDGAKHYFQVCKFHIAPIKCSRLIYFLKMKTCTYLKAKNIANC